MRVHTLEWFEDEDVFEEDVYEREDAFVRERVVVRKKEVCQREALALYLFLLECSDTYGRSG